MVIIFVLFIADINANTNDRKLVLTRDTRFDKTIDSMYDSVMYVSHDGYFKHQVIGVVYVYLYHLILLLYNNNLLGDSIDRL